jgi:hypothetical protein
VPHALKAVSQNKCPARRLFILAINASEVLLPTLSPYLLPADQRLSGDAWIDGSRRRNAPCACPGIDNRPSSSTRPIFASKQAPQLLSESRRADHPRQHGHFANQPQATTRRDRSRSQNAAPVQRGSPRKSRNRKVDSRLRQNRHRVRSPHPAFARCYCMPIPTVNSPIGRPARTWTQGLPLSDPWSFSGNCSAIRSHRDLRVRYRESCAPS